MIRVDKPGTSSNDILSRGKYSIAINLKTGGGQEVLKKLISTADIVIDPFRPGVLERLGLGPDVFLGNRDMKGLNKHLIYARIVGFVCLIACRRDVFIEFMLVFQEQVHILFIRSYETANLCLGPYGNMAGTADIGPVARKTHNLFQAMTSITLRSAASYRYIMSCTNPLN